MTIKFGTDGWRGIIARDFTFDNVRVCSQAVADYLKGARLAERGLIVSYDTRFASEDFAQTAAEVACGNGIKVYLTPRATPTPVVSYGVQFLKAGGAIIITASHNPPQWNGFKYKSETGASAPTEVIAELEKLVAQIVASGGVKQMPLSSALKQGLAEYTDLAPAYLKQLTSLVDLSRLQKAGLKIVFDAMYGTAAGYFEMLIGGGSGELIEINGERNPIFPGMKQPEPIDVNLVKLKAKVKEESASVGIATDGDGDRLGIIDEKGNYLTQLEVFGLLALYLLEVCGERGAIVKTLTTTSMLYRLGEIFNIAVYETPVGFKYIAPLMLKENALIGGEESGGYGFRSHVPERDGILSALYFLDLMARTGKTPSQLLDHLFSKVGRHHYNRVDIEFPKEERKMIASRLKACSPQSLDGVRVVKKDTVDGFRFTMADTSWLLIRFSGTEPLLRIYAESSSPARVERLLELGKELAGV